MATTPTTAPAAPQPTAPAPAAAISTPALITAMVKFNAKVSDLIISPHRPPQVELGGQLVVVPGLPVLSAQDTARLAADLIGTNKRAADFLKNDGACDTSYSIPDLARFRVNVFPQRGTYAIVMRTIPMVIPSFDDLKSRDLQAQESLPPSQPSFGLSMRPRPITSSPLKIRLSSCTRTASRRSISGSCIATRRPSPSPCEQRCGRRRRSSWLVKCATGKLSRSR